MNNYIIVDGVPTTVDYSSLSVGDMYRLPCGGTCVYMAIQQATAGNNSVNLRTGMIYRMAGAKQVVPIVAGTKVTVIAGGDD